VLGGTWLAVAEAGAMTPSEQEATFIALWTQGLEIAAMSRM
jgi:hypothetical protein